MKMKQVITAIAGAALIGGITEATKFFPNITEILVAANLLVSAIITFVVGKKEE